MTTRKSTVVYITAGAGGMYCGSCLHDNALCGALHQMGVDVQLLPMYTPIRTDEMNVSLDRVFMGGINVFLQQKSRLFRWLPSSLARLLDHPRLLRWATSRSIDTDANQLGDLTLSMLRGTEGNQGKEVQRLTDWLAGTVRPRLINLSNVLIAGCAPALKSSLDVPLLVTLQGDDVFLQQLPEPHRSSALEEIRRLIRYVDGFLVHSQYYADHMSKYLGLPRERFHQVKLGITTADFPPPGDDRPEDQARWHRAGRPPTIGYLARLAPEKGLHVLAEAFIRLRQRGPATEAKLRIAGWLGGQHRAYADGVFRRLKDAGCGAAYHYEGEVNREQKIRFLQEIDVLSVPTTYREPKGLYVLEALAVGVPVVQPRHGVFPELLRATGGGQLVRPEDPEDLADALLRLLTDETLRRQLGQRGRRAVHEQFSAGAAAQSLLEVYRKFLPEMV